MLKQYLIIFFVSMVPLIELRGAIPISQGFQLPFLPSYIVCIIGNMLPVPIIYLFARKVLEWGADKPVIGGFFSFCLERREKIAGESGQGIISGTAFVCGNPHPRHRGLDGNSGGKYFGYGF